METIQACVNARLLTKADRLFTGSLEGRIIEILQNSRRAGATKVVVTHHEGAVTVQDNGCGIEDFSRLLDLGGSGWEEALEASEDPAGVGIFCLAPREVTIRSKGRKVTITKDGWTGTPVIIEDDDQATEGTRLQFKDEPWTKPLVERLAVFTGVNVIVDGESCARDTFVSQRAAHHPELGCRIEVRPSDDLSQWHRANLVSYSCNVLVNFHGQTVSFSHHPISEQKLHYLIDLTDEPTGIRLMLPARTRLVENEAYTRLLAALELDAFRHVQRQGKHTLPYKEYLRARELGIPLSEAEPTYSVGLIGASEPPEPVEVVMPADFPLDRCYRLDPDCEDPDADATNAHLLAALGKFKKPFVPVEIRHSYDGYSWAKLPTITKVELSAGKERLSRHVWIGKLTCVDSLHIAAHTSDGKVFSSPVCMARPITPPPEGSNWFSGDHVLVTPEAEDRLWPSHIWHHFGGWSDEGDTYETQEYNFEQELYRFWADLVGPDEHLRQSLVSEAEHIKPKWQSVTIFADGKVVIRKPSGKEKTLEPPAASRSAGERRK